MGTSKAGGGGTAGGMRPLTSDEVRYLRSRGVPARRGQMTSQAGPTVSPSYRAGMSASNAGTSRGGRVSAREFQRATGVNPRTGERVRRRKK